MRFKTFQEFMTEAAAVGKTKYQVVRYAAPGSSKVVDSTVVHASNKAELHGHIRKFMEKGGLDPDDEDDHSHIKTTISK